MKVMFGEALYFLHKHFRHIVIGLPTLCLFGLGVWLIIERGFH